MKIKNQAKLGTVTSPSGQGNDSMNKDISKASDALWLKTQNESMAQEIKAYELRWQNTQRVLSKANSFIETTPTGEFKKPGFFTSLANWKTILEILLTLLNMFIAPKETKYWQK